MFYINEVSFRCTVSDGLVLACFLTNSHMDSPFRNVEMHSSLKSPICVPPFWESTYINIFPGWLLYKKHKGSAKAPQALPCFT